MSKRSNPDESHPFTAGALRAEHQHGEHDHIRRDGCPECHREALRAARKEASRRLPPGWDSSQASTAGGSVYVNVWRVFPDATDFERELASLAPLGSPPDPGGIDLSEVSPTAGYAVVTVAAVRKARNERPDLLDDTWVRSLRMVWSTLTLDQRLDPSEISKAIALISRPGHGLSIGEPPVDRRKAGRPREQPHLFYRRYREARAKLGTEATDDELATSAGYSPVYFGRLIAKHGRPH